MSLLLKGAAALFIVTGTFIAVWLVDKAIRYPYIQAGQFGAHAPLWIPMTIFVIICTVAASYLFIRASRRIDAGEDLYGNRRKSDR